MTSKTDNKSLIFCLMVIWFSQMIPKSYGISSRSLAEKLMITGKLSRKADLVERLRRYDQKNVENGVKP